MGLMRCAASGRVKFKYLGLGSVVIILAWLQTAKMDGGKATIRAREHGQRVPSLFIQSGPPRTATTFQFQSLCLVMAMLHPKEEIDCIYNPLLENINHSFSRPTVLKSHDDVGKLKHNLPQGAWVFTTERTTRSGPTNWQDLARRASRVHGVPVTFVQSTTSLKRYGHRILNNYQTIFSLNDSQLYMLIEYFRFWVILHQCCGRQMSTDRFRQSKHVAGTKHHWKADPTAPKCNIFSISQVETELIHSSSYEKFARASAQLRMVSNAHGELTGSYCVNFTDALRRGDYNKTNLAAEVDSDYIFHREKDEPRKLNIALCVAGEGRTLDHHLVRESQMKYLLTPLRRQGHLDVFVVMAPEDATNGKIQIAGDFYRPVKTAFMKLSTLGQYDRLEMCRKMMNHHALANKITYDWAIRSRPGSFFYGALPTLDTLRRDRVHLRFRCYPWSKVRTFSALMAPPEMIRYVSKLCNGSVCKKCPVLPGCGPQETRIGDQFALVPARFIPDYFRKHAYDKSWGGPARHITHTLVKSGVPLEPTALKIALSRHSKTKACNQHVLKSSTDGDLWLSTPPNEKRLPNHRCPRSSNCFELTRRHLDICGVCGGGQTKFPCVSPPIDCTAFLDAQNERALIQTYRCLMKTINSMEQLDRREPLDAAKSNRQLVQARPWWKVLRDVLEGFSGLRRNENRTKLRVAVVSPTNSIDQSPIFRQGGAARLMDDVWDTPPVYPAKTIVALWRKFLLSWPRAAFNTTLRNRMYACGAPDIRNIFCVNHFLFGWVMAWDADILVTPQRDVEATHAQIDAYDVVLCLSHVGLGGPCKLPDVSTNVHQVRLFAPSEGGLKDSLDAWPVKLRNYHRDPIDLFGSMGQPGSKNTLLWWSWDVNGIRSAFPSEAERNEKSYYLIDGKYPVLEKYLRGRGLSSWETIGKLSHNESYKGPKDFRYQGDGGLFKILSENVRYLVVGRQFPSSTHSGQAIAAGAILGVPTFSQDSRLYSRLCLPEFLTFVSEKELVERIRLLEEREGLYERAQDVIKAQVSIIDVKYTLSVEQLLNLTSTKT